MSTRLCAVRWGIAASLAGLFAFTAGILYSSKSRVAFIEARAQSLIVQGELIAIAIANQTMESDAVDVDPKRLLELKAGESYCPLDNAPFGFESPVNPERVMQLLRRMTAPTNVRARIYDRDGTLILDSRNLRSRDEILNFNLTPPPQGFLERTAGAIKSWLLAGNFPLYEEIGTKNSKGYPEVDRALAGQKAWFARNDGRGELNFSAAVPIQRYRVINGALLLTSEGRDL